MSTKKQNRKRKQRGEFEDIDQLAAPERKKVFTSNGQAIERAQSKDAKKGSSKTRPHTGKSSHESSQRAGRTEKTEESGTTTLRQQKGLTLSQIKPMILDLWGREKTKQ